MGDVDYDIASVSYSDTSHIVTITLTNPLQSGDTPRLFITTTVMGTLIDLAGNYYNDENTSDHPVLDRIAPVISLVGSPFVTLVRGTSYIDEGAACVDVVDTTCTVTSTGSVDTNTPGTYTLTFSATDTSGNDAEDVTRTVTVTAPVAPPSG